MARILVQHLPGAAPELSTKLRSWGHEVLETAQTDQPLDLVVADCTGQDARDTLAGLDALEWLRFVPLVVIADTPPTQLHSLTVAAWLTAPYEELEVLGMLRGILSSRAAMNGQGDLASIRRSLDTTQRERDELEAAEQKKDEFISYMSHELKNPMASIKGYSDLMRRRLAKTPDDPNRKGLDIISSQVGRMTMLLDQLLDFSRISMNRLQIDSRPVNLVAAVSRLIDEIQPTIEHHALQFTSENTSLLVRADENRLRQALQYLISNAVKFSPNPSTIVIRVETQDQHALVSISDKGIGIPEADQQRVFERFERGSNIDGNSQGLGLGLFLASEIVARHDGAISVESKPGEGSTFQLRLPLQKEVERPSTVIVA